MPFQFKHFSVDDLQSTQRVGTDAMLLGAWADAPISTRILDIGTGCGVLALMLAQKTSAKIDAIDIDESSVAEASANFHNSAWNNRLSAFCISLQAFSRQLSLYDYIITNPPFFSSSLPSPDKRRSYARHDDRLPMQELIRAVATLLSPVGRFALILPVKESDSFIQQAYQASLYLLRKTTVFPKRHSPPKRVLMEFGRTSRDVIAGNELIILESDGSFSSEYLTLTADFHNF